MTIENNSDVPCWKFWSSGSGFIGGILAAIVFATTAFLAYSIIVYISSVPLFTGVIDDQSNTISHSRASLHKITTD